jgi:hypothetical protein
MERYPKESRSTKEVPIGKKVSLRYQFEKTGKEKLGAGKPILLIILTSEYQ